MDAAFGRVVPAPLLITISHTSHTVGCSMPSLPVLRFSACPHASWADNCGGP